MSAEAQVRRLESLLERVQQRRGSRGASSDEEEVTSEHLELAAANDRVAKSRTPTPTPMEQALTSAADDEPELQLIVEDDDDEPELIIESGPPLSMDDMPTAPIDTPSPVRPSRAPKQVARITPKRRAAAASGATGARGTRSPSRPDIVEIPAAKASEPVARIAKRPAPKTFGELLRRTLALRPK